MEQTKIKDECEKDIIKIGKKLDLTNLVNDDDEEDTEKEINEIKKDVEKKTDINREEIPNDEFEQIVDRTNVNLEIVKKIEHSRLKMKIKQYLELFKNQLTEIKFRENMSIEQMEILLEEIKFTIGCKGLSDMAISTYTSGIDIIEKVATRISPLKLNGLSFVVNNDPTIKNCLNEMLLESTIFSYISPQQRLLFQTMKLASEVHCCNTTNMELIKLQNSKVENQKVENQKVEIQS